MLLFCTQSCKSRTFQIFEMALQALSGELSAAAVDVAATSVAAPDTPAPAYAVRTRVCIYNDFPCPANEFSEEAPTVNAQVCQ